MTAQVNYPALARRELARREKLAEMKAEAEQDFLAFVRMFWSVLEPEKPLVEGWVLETLADVLMAITDGHMTRVSFNIVPGSGKSSILNCFFPAFEWGPMNMPHLRYLSISYSTIVPERDNIRFARIINSPVYQKCWGDRVKLIREGSEVVENDRTGWKRVSSTGGSVTGLRGDRLLLDDLNNPMNVESDEVRSSTNRFVREIMPDRVNDLQLSAIINLQQRTHEDDATGTLIKHGQGFSFICIPMEFDPLRIFPVELRPGTETDDGEILPAMVWTDPRALDEDGKMLEGLYTNARGEPKVRIGSPMARAEFSICWPERFSDDEVQKLKATKGQYAWDCNPGDAPILMADLSMKPLGAIQVGDEIVGFETGCEPRRESEKFGRRRLVRTKVLDIHAAVRPVVRVTLDSGRVIRCTPNHKWFTGRTPNDKTHPLYAQAKVGRSLMRVCDPTLPEITDLEVARMAGWLGGFYEGEGTVCAISRREGDTANANISFAQSDGKNLPICEELERVLTALGFEWGVWRKHRVEDHAPVRIYWLKKGGLPLYQKFIHLVRPIKWRDRLVEAAFSSNFIRDHERVVSIEPCGEEVVYGLTTGTGNYVVWGLASSNSQYNQIPGVRGGAIIRKEWWRLWQAEEYPEMGTRIVSLDTAIEDNNQADYNACTSWGAFAGAEGEPLILLTDAWRARMPLAELVSRVAETCRRQAADYLLIEHKTRGRDVHDEIVRLYREATWSTVLVKAEISKIARLKAVEHLFSGDYRKDPITGIESWDGGVVYCPDKQYADDVMAEVASFPFGSHDDYTDTVSQAIGWIRKNGVVLRRQEWEAEELEARRYRKAVAAPYAIRR